ncbi:hypothetical protein [Hungatella hathewayi]|uniref:hypothetical protein n=1 Tax=Hungatella hathewayi TaxID=154046 RepID=UPI00165241D8|nr:hypothetical protein [Hungatella hathewayi]
MITNDTGGAAGGLTGCRRRPRLFLRERTGREKKTKISAAVYGGGFNDCMRQSGKEGG